MRSRKICISNFNTLQYRHIFKFQIRSICFVTKKKKTRRLFFNAFPRQCITRFVLILRRLLYCDLFDFSRHFVNLIVKIPILVYLISAKFVKLINFINAYSKMGTGPIRYPHESCKYIHTYI